MLMCVCGMSLGFADAPCLCRLKRMLWALRIRMMFSGSGPSTILADLVHRNSYALFTFSNVSYIHTNVYGSVTNPEDVFTTTMATSTTKIVPF